MTDQGFIRRRPARLSRASQFEAALFERVADDVERLAPVGNDSKQVTLDHLNKFAGEGLRTFSLPVDLRRDGATVDLADGADEILDYFRGSGPLPPEPVDTPPPDSTSGDADG